VSAPGGEFGRNAALDGGAGTVNVQPAMVTTDQSGCTIGRARTTNNGVAVNNGSTFDNGGGLNATCNYTNGMNGTSSSTPVTVGVIALILEANPALTWRDVKHILASTSSKIDPARAAVNVALTGGTYVAEPARSPTPRVPFSQLLRVRYGRRWGGVNMAKAHTPGSLGALTNTGFVASAALSLAIPDQSVTGASDTITVPTNPVHVIEAVQIRVSVTHPFDGDLGIELLSPSGTRSVLKNIKDGYFDSANLSNQVFLSNAFYGENPAGNWTIKVVDGFSGGVGGQLTGWAIRVYGH
jgi:subtilisin-like proprotein convertase family protein